LVRVDLDEGGAVEKKIRDLQDKSDREYYIESMNLEPGEIYFNDFDLNVEHGVIEIPYKPVIRVTTKLENANGNGLRILIVNFSGAKLIDEIHQLTSSKFGNVELINSEGYWLSSNEEYREWGFKFLDKEYLNMANLYHNQWNVMNRYKKGFFKTEQGWMTTLLYKPDDEESHQIFISSNIPETMIDDELGNLRTNTQLIIILVGVTASSLAYFSMKISIARKKHKEQIKRQAHYDTLTGVANRLKFNQDLIEWVDESEKADNMFAVFFMDLDGFKNVNDTFGHEIGDRVLKDVAKRLLHVIRGEDQTYRLGGDEFTIILKRIKEREDVELVAKKIINAVSHPYVYDSEIRCVIGVSIGISIYPFDAKEDNGLINIADDMMYEVKKSGKNNFKYNS